jgi:hypothetical protein
LRGFDSRRLHCSQVTFLSLWLRKKDSGVSAAAVDFLSGLRLDGSQRELREILGELSEAEVSDANLNLLRGAEAVTARGALGQGSCCP